MFYYCHQYLIFFYYCAVRMHETKPAMYAMFHLVSDIHMKRSFTNLFQYNA